MSAASEPAGSTDTVIQPPLSDWLRYLSEPMQNSPETLPGRLRADARRSLLKTARRYTSQFEALPVSRIIENLLDGDPDQQQILMTGHQPVVFHSGLAFKYRVAEQMAAEAGAIGIAVVIDTDEGDAGRFGYPAIDERIGDSHEIPHLMAGTGRLSSPDEPGLFGNQWLSDAAEIARVNQVVGECLNTVGCVESKPQFDTAMAGYRRLAEFGRVRMGDANIAVRRAAGIGRRFLEIPLSLLCREPAVTALMSDVIHRGREYAEIHNSVLERFRASEGIRNAANPFPNLTIEGNLVELPFWLVDWTAAGRRFPLQALITETQTELLTAGRSLGLIERSASVETLLKELGGQQQLIPRGAMITAIMRSLFADVFVHGTGGGKYDRFTDQLLTAWWGVEPTAITVASTSRRLFAESRAAVKRLTSIEQQLRDLMYNPQRSLGQSVFSAELEEKLRSLLAQKDVLTSEMRMARETGGSAKDTGIRMQRLTEEIRGLVQAEFSGPLAELRSLSEDHRSVLESRTWPWFFFEWK